MNHNRNSAMITTGSGFDRRTADQMIAGLTELTLQCVGAGFEPSLLSFMYAGLPGSPAAVVGQMRDEATRVYSTLITRAARDPRRSVGLLPVMIAAPDLPVAKRDRPTGNEIALNGGLHMHAVLLVPPGSRLRTSVEEHFRLNQSLYLRDRSRLDRIDVRPVTRTPELAVGYVLKAVRRGRFDYDDVLILPRAVAELCD